MRPSEPKPHWNALSPELRNGIEKRLGSSLISAEIEWGGFTPMGNYRLVLHDGRTVFCKADHASNSEWGHLAFHREKEVLESFPELARFSPRYLGYVPAGPEAAMLFDFVSDRVPLPPWDAEKLRRITAQLLALHDLEVEPMQATSAEGRSESQFSPRFEPLFGWRELLDDPSRVETFCSFFPDPSCAQAWLDLRADSLLREESQASSMAWTDGSIHLDLRSDNILFSRSLGPLFIDWPYFKVGPRIMDLGFLIPSVASENGPSAGEVIQEYERQRGAVFDRTQVEVAAVLVTGFFASRAPLPEVPGLPRLRWIQREQLRGSLHWLCQTLKIEAPGDP